MWEIAGYWVCPYVFIVMKVSMYIVIFLSKASNGSFFCGMRGDDYAENVCGIS